MCGIRGAPGEAGYGYNAPVSPRSPDLVETTRSSLLIRIRNRGDAQAWATFDDIYRPMLTRFALSLGLNRADADDVVQHCMSAVVDQLETFRYDREQGRFKAWLRTLVGNRVRDLWRKRARTPASVEWEHIPARDPSPDRAFEQFWLEEHLRHCLRELRREVSSRDYRAFERYAIEQRPADEVAEELGISRGNLHTIKWRLTERIAQKMKALLGEAVAE